MEPLHALILLRPLCQKRLLIQIAQTVGNCEAGDTALIARRGAEPVLGVEALEALGLTVDPRSRKLTPSRARAVLLVSTRPARRR